MRSHLKPLQSEFHPDSSERKQQKPGNLFEKHYPSHARREDIHRDFIALQQELRSVLPDVRVIKEDIDASLARLQFDAPASSEKLLEQVLIRRRFIKLA